MFSNQPVETLTFITKKDGGRQFPVPLSIYLRCISNRANHPNVTFFQLVYQSNKVCYARDWNILERARRNLRNNVSQSRCTSFGNEDPMNASAFGRSQNRTHITRIFNTVQPEHKGWILSTNLVFEHVEQIVCISIARGGNASHHSLMSGLAHASTEAQTGHTVDGYLLLPRELKQLFESIGSGTFKDSDRFDLSLTRAYGFNYRV
jgi:hypothetical protein